MTEKQKVKLRKEVYQLLKVNDATNKLSWWNLADDVVDLILDQRKEVVEVLKLMNEDRAKELCDQFELVWGKRSCKVCGYNPERQRKHIKKLLTNK